MAKTKAQRVIDFVKRSKKGRTFGEIQRFIVEMNGMDYDDHHIITDYSHKPPKQKRVRTWRGYWCDYLCDTYKYKSIRDEYGHWRMDCQRKSGLLSKYFVKYQGRYYNKYNLPLKIKMGLIQ